MNLVSGTENLAFRRSHPWITFDLSLDSKLSELWLDLGEAASKCEHLAGVPLRPDIAARLNQVYLAKGARATTAIEGNTLTEKEVLGIVQGRLDLPPSQEYLRREVDNVVRALNRLTDKVCSPQEGPEVCPDEILRMNAEIRDGLKEPEGISPPGVLRTESVLVGGVYRGAPPQDCTLLLDLLCEWINGSDFSTPSDRYAKPFVILKAIVAHLYIAWIHPFSDGNGRTARLLEFQILLAGGVPVPAAHLLSDHYNRTRSEYYRQLEAASRSGAGPVPFIHYAVEGFVDGIRKQIREIRDQQWEVSWENFVHQQFHKTPITKVQERRRDLVLGLSYTDEKWVEASEIPLLNPRLARAYASRSDRTLNRDIKAAVNMGLLERRLDKVRARREIILAFLPARAPEADGL